MEDVKSLGHKQTGSWRLGLELTGRGAGAVGPAGCTALTVV
jgi:hypothetical protein